jgi:2-methylcitrate dehydratase
MVRYLDYDDGYMIKVGPLTSGGHPSEVIPAVLALGEREHTKGRDVINAVVLGYELSARFMQAMVVPNSLAPTPGAKGWNEDTRGIFVMPIVAGKLLKLSEEKMEQAIGISGCHNMVLGILDATGEEYSMTKNLRFPRTCYGGILSALMAQKGFTGPARVMEGNKGFIEAVMRKEFDLEKLTEKREELYIYDTIYKAFATDATTHGHLTATVELVKEHDIKPGDIETVKILAPSRCTEHTGDPVKRHPNTKESADHSSYYITAIGIIDRKVGPDQFTVKKMKDPKVHELIDKIEMKADPSLDQFGRAGVSEIRLKNGTTYKKRVEYPRGDRLNRMTDLELEEKFRDMAERFMTKEQIKKIFAMIYDLDKLDDIGKLMKLMAFKKK